MKLVDFKGRGGTVYVNPSRVLWIESGRASCDPVVREREWATIVFGDGQLEILLPAECVRKRIEKALSK